MNLINLNKNAKNRCQTQKIMNSIKWLNPTVSKMTVKFKIYHQNLS